MYGTKTLTELAKELDANESAKKDFVADTRQLRVDVVGEEKNRKLALDISGHAITGLTHHAHMQIADRIKIPATYYRRMVAEAPDLLARNVNHWFNESPERRMVRTLHGDTRAFLSDRYRPLDNFDLAQCVLPVLAEQPGMKVESCEVTDRRMYIKALFPRIEREVKRGDVVQSGVVISNSEIGAGSLRVEPLVYRLVCLNGMIGSTAMRKYHVGRGADSNDDGAMEIFRDETRIADDKALWLKVEDVVRSSVSEANFDTLVTSMQEALQVRMEASPVQVVENVAKAYRLNEKEQGNVLTHLIEGGDLSQYGLMNAVTRASQDVEDYDRATEMERMGGLVLELPRTEWQRIAA